MELLKKERVLPNQYELEVSVSPEDFEIACSAAFRKEGRKMSVPGFRKGKAPRKMIERLFGESVFFEEAVNQSYPQALEYAVKAAEIEIIDRPEVEMIDMSKEKGYTFKAVCITYPEIEIEGYKGIKAKKLVKTVTDQEIDQEIDRMLDGASRLVNIEDRAAKDGDTVIFDFEGFADGTAFDGGKAEGYSLVLGSGQFIPGFEEQIVGKNIGEDFDVNVTFPEEYHAENLKGKPALFKCKISEIKEKETPELDDEFAKDVSEFDTLDQLKEDVKKKIGLRNEQVSQQYLDDQLNAILAKMITTPEIPDILYTRQLQNIYGDFERRLQSQGMDMESYSKYSNTDFGQIHSTLNIQAKKSVNVRLALTAIAKQENIEVTEEDLTAEYEKLAEQYMMSADKIRELVPESELSKDILATKAYKLVLGAADLEEVDEIEEIEEVEEEEVVQATDSEEEAETAEETVEIVEAEVVEEETEE
ncbi:MAG: trigger factor [Oscillospiraceae bacterium]|nr:trigger factor [Oscillospiraceae bacterium]